MKEVAAVASTQDMATSVLNTYIKPTQSGSQLIQKASHQPSVKQTVAETSFNIFKFKTADFFFAKRTRGKGPQM